MLFLAMLLLCDTILFVILGKFLARSLFFVKMHWLIFLLFPWFGMLLWLAQPGRSLYQNNRRRYSQYQIGLYGAGVTLIVFGVLGPDDAVYIFGVLLCLWLWIGDVLVHRDEGDGTQDDPSEPEPDDPTPTGDAADTWLKELGKLPMYR